MVVDREGRAREMAEEQELPAVEELLRMDAVWAEPPEDLQQRIHTELFGGPDE